MIKSLTNSSITNEKKYRSMMAGSVENNADHLIAETVLGSAVSSVTFDVSSLAALGYKHLQIRVVAVSTQANWCSIRFNSDSGNNYASHYLHGNGSSALSGYGGGSVPQMGMMFIAGGANPACGIIDIVDAFSTSKNKTVRSLHGYSNSGPEVALSSGVWLSTAAISSIQLIHGSADFSATSRFSLYASKG